MSVIKREDLIKAAKELNDVLGLDPQIKTGKKVTEKELSEQILEAAELILPEDDISDETIRVIKLLQGESVEDEEDEEVEAEEEFEDEEEEEMEEDDAEDVDVEDEDEFEEEEEEMKPASKGVTKKEKKEQKEQKPKAKKTPPVPTSLTRVAAAALAIKNSKRPLTIEELVKAADELYVKEGGKSNLNESRSNVTKALHALIAFGVVEEKDGAVRVK